MSAIPSGSLSPLEALPMEIHGMILGLFCSHCCPVLSEDRDAEEECIDDLVRLANTSVTLRRTALCILLHQPHKCFSQAVQIRLFDQLPQIGMHVKTLAVPFGFQAKPPKARVDVYNKIASRQIARFGVNLGHSQTDMNTLLLHYSLESELTLSFATGVKSLKLVSNGHLIQFRPKYVNDEEPKYPNPDELVPKGGRLLSFANRGTYAQGKPGTLFPHLEEIYCGCHALGDSDPPSPGLEILRQIIRGTAVLKSFTYAPDIPMWPGDNISPSAILTILEPREKTLESLTLKWSSNDTPDTTLGDGPALDRFSKLERLELCETMYCARIVHGRSHDGPSNDTCLTKILPKTVKTLSVQFLLSVPDPADVFRLASDVKKGRFPALETLECVMSKMSDREATINVLIGLPDEREMTDAVMKTIRDAFEGTSVNVVFRKLH